MPMPQTRIILASSSIGRKTLLERLQIPFSVIPPEIDETPRINEEAIPLVKRLALEKAQKIAQNQENALIIGSDQVAACDGHILGKPSNFENATQQLSLMSGKTVIFQTALCLLNSKSLALMSEVVPTTVRFRVLTPEQIKAYLEKEKPFGCAGCFKSEGLGITLIEKIESDDPSALIGLPLIRLTDFLIKQGIKLP